MIDGVEYAGSLAGLGDLGHLLNGTSRWFGNEGVVLLDRAEHLPDAEREARREGWQFSELRTWTSFRRGRHNVHIGLMGSINDSRTPLWDAGEPWPVIGRRLAEYHVRTGVAWRATAGTSGVAMIRNRWAGAKQPYWRGGYPRDQRMFAAGDLSWSRPATSDERAGGVAHLDANAAYLGAASSAPLAWDALADTGAIPFDKKRSGYWLVDPSQLIWPAVLPPVCNVRRADAHGRVWVTTPILQLVLQYAPDAVIDVYDSWTAPATAWLKPWAQHMRDVRSSAMADDVNDHVLKAIKSTYAEAVGMMERAEGKGRIWRPDWRHTIVDLARANLLRKIYQVWTVTQLAPLAVSTDSVWYPDVAAVRSALTPFIDNTGMGIGKLKIADRLPYADYAGLGESEVMA